MKEITGIIEYDVSAAEREITGAWKDYKQNAEPLGLKFGETCYEWRKKFKAQGKKGQGLIPMLEQVGIPTSTRVLLDGAIRDQRWLKE